MGKHRTFSRYIQKKRKMSLGDTALPTSLTDFTDILDQFKDTNDGEDWCILNTVIWNDGEIVIRSCSSSLKAVLANSSTWSLDGTFDIKKWTLSPHVSSFLISYLTFTKIFSF